VSPPCLCAIDFTTIRYGFSERRLANAWNRRLLYFWQWNDPENLQRGRDDREEMEMKAFSDRTGSVLVLVLLLLVFLVTVVSEFAYDIFISTSSLQNWYDGVRLRELADSGVEVAKEMINEERSRRSYTYPESITLPVTVPGIEDTLVIQITDEQAKFNINSLVFPNGNDNPEAINQFRRLLSLLDLDEAIADRLADWLDPDSLPRPGGDEDGAGNRKMFTLEELKSLKGIDQETYRKLSAHVTVYGDIAGRININTADPLNLMALHEAIDRTLAERLVQYREEAPLKSVSSLGNVPGFRDMITPLAGRYVVKSGVFGIMATANAGRVKREVQEVVDLNAGGKVLYYRAL